jgi:hypothetical protein
MRRYGLVDIPETAEDIDAVPISRTLTINGTTYDLSANRSWTISTSSTNIYNTDGTLTANRTLTHGGYHLTFTGGTYTNRFTSTGRLLLGTTIESTNLLDVVNGAASFTMPSYNSQQLLIRNYDGTIDWQFYNNGNTSTARPFIHIPRWKTGTPIIIAGSSNSGSTANAAIMIGGGNSNGSNLSNESIRIGNNGNANIGNGSITIGQNSIANANYSISITSGEYTSLATVLNDYCFSIGSGYEGTTTNTFQGILAAKDIYIGRPAKSTSYTGNTYQGVETSLNGMGGYGIANATGGNLSINAGIGLGSGTPGDLIFKTASTTTSGTTIQTLTERLRIKATDGSVRFQPIATPGTAQAGDVYYDNTTNKLRCYDGTAWNDLF